MTRSHPLRTIAPVLLVAAACSSDGTGTITPDTIRFTTTPAAAVAGEPFTVTVELVGRDGERVTGGRAYVSLSLNGQAALSGGTTIASAMGLAAFDDLVITRAGEGYRLDALASGRSAMSAPFDVRPASAVNAMSSFAPEGFQWFEGTSIELAFTFADVFGNPLAEVPVSLTSSIAGQFSPANGTTSTMGVFETVFTPGASGAATFTATVDGRALTFTTPFTVTAFCTPETLPIPGAVNGVLPSGNCNWNGRDAAVYRFTQNEIGAVAVTIAFATFQPRVEVKRDITATNPQFLPIPQSPTVEWLLTPGTFLFRLRAETGSGGYTLQTNTNPGNTGTAARAIITSGTFPQSLQANDRDFGDETRYDYFLMFDAERACTVTMRSTEFDAYLWGEDALAQEFIVQDNNSAGGTDARVIITPCSVEGRPVGIFANAYPVDAGLGAYTLTVEFTPVVNTDAAVVASAPAVLDGLVIRPADVPVLRPGSRIRR